MSDNPLRNLLVQLFRVMNDTELDSPELEEFPPLPETIRGSEAFSRLRLAAIEFVAARAKARDQWIAEHGSAEGFEVALVPALKPSAARYIAAAQPDFILLMLETIVALAEAVEVIRPTLREAARQEAEALPCPHGKHRPFCHDCNVDDFAS